MMKSILKLFVLSTLAVYMTGCATIVGGKNYNAKVEVIDHPDATIKYNGNFQGKGVASFLAPRKEADNFVITVSEEGCPEETVNFNTKVFRGWAFVGTLVTFTGLTVNGAFLPIPFGVIVDGATGAWWKPDEKDFRISKINHNNFLYRIPYTGCDQKSANE